MKKLLSYTFTTIVFLSVSFALTTPVFAEALSDNQTTYEKAVALLRTKYSDLDTFYMEANMDLSFLDYLTIKEFDIIDKTLVARTTSLYWEEQDFLNAMCIHSTNSVLCQQAFYDDVYTYVEAIFPTSITDKLGGIHFFTDGRYGTTAATSLLDKDPTKVELSIDIIDLVETTIQSSKDLYLSTLVHEAAHIIELSDGQLQNIHTRPVDWWKQSQWEATEEANCQTVFEGLGCATETAYIYNFYRTFWENNYPDRAAELSTWDEYDAYLEDYPDDFVSAYATSELSEDFAESFTYFVLGPNPNETRKLCQKIDFFYEFKEFRKLRVRVREVFETAEIPTYWFFVCEMEEYKNVAVSEKSGLSELRLPNSSPSASYIINIFVASTFIITTVIIWVVNIFWFRWVFKK